MSDKKVAIIVVTYNASKYLGELFSSLENLNYPKDKFEIVIIDNASTDGTQEILKSQVLNLKSKKFYVSCFMFHENSGFVGGNNIGLQYAVDNDFDYAYMLNQDTVVDPNFLEEAINVAESDEKIGAVQSLLLLNDRKDTINSMGNHIHYLGFAYAGGNGEKVQSSKFKVQSYEITYPSGAAVLLRCTTLMKIGLLHPELFMYHEDVELGWRIWLFGYKIMLAPKSIVYHKYEFSRSMKKYYYMERNRFIVFLEKYKLATIVLIFPALVLMEILMFAYSFVSGFWKEKLHAYGYFFHISSWKKIFSKRLQNQTGRVISDREIIHKFVGVIQFQEAVNPFVKYIFNPLFHLYFIAIKFFIFW